MKRTQIVDMIRQEAPGHPPCFETQDEWIAWLCMAHITGIRLLRRADRGMHRRAPDRKQFRLVRYEILPTERIDYCCDCTGLHRAHMLDSDRCRPSQVSDPPSVHATEESHV